ncbi:MBL fold metallo-hydrolase [Micromonospora sp. LOL_023]|uniref:MBL fold metallo-hydrolase n=1 Tax=Micromonospora sp. LOL_023 TaxID=3345418 RepID=UPI003A8ADE0B
MATTSDWMAPGVFPVAHGVHRIPLPMPDDGLRAVNVYAIEDDAGLVLIDAGWAVPAARAALEAALRELGRDLGGIWRFLVTHIHQDHYSQAVSIRRETGVPVALGIGERPSLEFIAAGTNDPYAASLAQLHAAGAGELVDEVRRLTRQPGQPELDWQPPDEWLSGERDVALSGRLLRALPTPGHTAGHYVFRDPAAGLLFAGDHVLPGITPSVGFEAVAAHRPLGCYLDSLRAVRALPDALLLPAHGPVTDSVHRRVDELLAHHDERLAEIGAAVVAGAGTAYQVALTMPWTRHRRKLDDLAPYHRMLAVNETALHLDLLVERGLLTASWVDGVGAYRPAG